MSRRTNGTNRAMIEGNFNYYTGKKMPKRRRAVSLNELNGRINKGIQLLYQERGGKSI